MPSQAFKCRLFGLAWLLISFSAAFGQPGDPNGGGRPAPRVPIVGLEFILIAGGLWGGWRIYDMKVRYRADRRVNNDVPDETKR